MGYVVTAILNFILWGSGTFLETRHRRLLLAVLLHAYLWSIALQFATNPIVWFVFVPVLGLGGAYFTLDIRREQTSQSEITSGNANRRFCTSCGKKVTSMVRFCSNCGESQDRQ